MTPTDAEIEAFIREALEENYELLKLESGHSLSNDVKDTALQQALFYWRKLKDVAARVTETEVRLNLPGQETPEGRKFGIEGVVDIVWDDETTVMYDIKTHDAEYVVENLASYEAQLSIYAHIWHNLRGQPLDKTAVIATAYPEGVKQALADRDQARLEHELDQWNPLVEIEVNPGHVQAMIADFGHVVDCIENGNFDPAPIDKLKSRYGAENSLFATRVCRNCDARFSCVSYRRYALGSRGRAELALKAYLTDFGSDLDQQEWLSGNLEGVAPAESLD